MARESTSLAIPACRGRTWYSERYVGLAIIPFSKQTNLAGRNLLAYGSDDRGFCLLGSICYFLLIIYVRHLLKQIPLISVTRALRGGVSFEHQAASEGNNSSALMIQYRWKV